jgi:hypothetical protein
MHTEAKTAKILEKIVLFENLKVTVLGMVL